MAVPHQASLSQEGPGALRFGGSRMALFDIEAGFWGLRREVEALAGRRLADAVLQQAGVAGGASFARAFVGQAAAEDAPDALRDCVAAYQAAGFGEFQIETIEWPIGRAVVRAADTFEAWAAHRHGEMAEAPICAYTAGVLVGFFNAVGGRQDVVCVEHACRAQGAEACLFEILPAGTAEDPGLVAFEPDPLLSQRFNLLEILFDRMPVGIAIFDRDLRLRRCNPTWAGFIARYTPTPPHKIVPGARFLELAPGTQETTLLRYRRALAGETVREEAVPMRSDGFSSYWDVVVAPLMRNGEVVGIVDVTADATERKRAEEALRKSEDELRQHRDHLEELVADRTAKLTCANAQLQQEIAERRRAEEALRSSEEKYRELVENANSIILRLDTEGNVTFCNEYAQAFFGYEEEEILGRNVVGTIVPPVDSAGRDLRGMVEDFRRHPDQYASNENENVRRNGERVWIAWANKAIPDEQGRIVEILCVGNDHTDRKRAEEALQKARDELSTLLAVAQAASSSLDVDEVLGAVSKAMVAAAGVRHCGVYVVDEATGLLMPRRGADPHGLTTQFQDTYRALCLDPARDGFTREVLESKEPRICYDALTDPRTNKDTARLLGLKSVLAVPFVVKGRVVAVAMICTFDEPYVFTQAHVDLTRGIANAAAVAIENARLYAETRRHADEIQTLFAVQQAITSRLDPDAVLQLIADESRRLTSARRTAVFLREGDDLCISVVSGENVPEELIGYRMPIAQSLTGSAVLTRKPVRVEDAPHAPRVHASLVQSLGIQSFISVPLISGGQSIGAICVTDKLSGAFTAEDERVLVMLAAGAAIGLENARSYREEQDRRYESEQRRHVAESLRDILAILNSNRPLAEILDYIVAQACRLMRTGAGAIYRLREDGKTLAVQAALGLPADYVAGVTIPMGHGIIGQAAQTRQPLAVTDMAAAFTDEATLPDNPRDRALVRDLIARFPAMLAVPLVVKDELYGGIALYYPEPCDFSPEEIALLTTFADQAALAIGNARLRAQVEATAAAAERSRLARDLHDAVTQTLFSASLIAEVLPRIWVRNPDEGHRRLEELRQLTRGALAEMRTLLLELRPAALTEAPLGDLLRQLCEAVTGRARVPVSLAVEGQPAVPQDVQIALYRIAQEALNNVAKHSAATEAAVALRCLPGRVELNVSDDGRGFDPGPISKEHLGLSIMTERAEAIGAMLKITSQPGHGTQVAVTWQDKEARE